MNERGRDGAKSEWVFLNSVVGAVQCKRAATGAGRVENGANKANRQPKVRPYATMVFGSISADVQAKTNPSMRGRLSSEAVQVLCRGLPHIPFAVGFGRSGPSQTYPRTIQVCTPRHIL